MSLISIRVEGFEETVTRPLVSFQRTMALRLMAQAIKDGILERTDKGVDSNLQPFAEYAELTQELRMHQGLRLAPPDLRWSGDMLDGIYFDNAQFLRPAAEDMHKAGKHQWGGVTEDFRTIPQRRFMDARDEDVRRGERLIVNALTLGTQPVITV